MDVFVITDTTHGALNSEKREYDWYDRSAAMAVAMAKYQVASQEAETLDKEETLDEEETFDEEATISEEEKSLEAEASDTESLETDIYETESGKADDIGGQTHSMERHCATRTLSPPSQHPPAQS